MAENKKQVCYIVECVAGSFDDIATWIEGVFTDPFEAEKLKRKIEIEMDVLKNLPCPIELDDDSEQINKLNNDQRKAYLRWYSNNQLGSEFRCANVAEYELNKPLNVYKEMEL